MLVEYLPEGAPESPLIRVFGTSAAEFARLQSVADELGQGIISSKELLALEGFRGVNIKSLEMVAGANELGVAKTSRDGFRWVLDREGRQEVSELIVPFTRSPHPPGVHFQWLCGVRSGLAVSRISILLSHSSAGQW